MERPMNDQEPRDRGSAMVITLMVLALVTALSTTVAVVTIDNLIGSRRAQQAGAALAAADAGIAQAMSYLRNNGVRDLKCTAAAPAAAACTANDWGSGKQISVNLPGASGQSYRVWIEAVRPFPTYDPGTYRIHSTGTAAGPASREVVTDVSVTTAPVPKGIFARTINGGGDAAVARESIFSTGCVYNRSKIQMSGIDVAYGIPVAVHSSQIITDSNGTGQYCPNTDKAIHRDKWGNPTPCSTASDPLKDYRYDQDSFGGDLSSTTCASVQSNYPAYYGPKNLDGTAGNDVHGSYIKDDATLFTLFGIRSPALTQSQVDQMKTIAQAQGNYWNSATGWSSPDEPNAVMFFDLKGSSVGATVDLNDITGFGRIANVAATDAACTTRSLIILVEGGNVKLNSNQQLAASVFLLSGAPYGQVLKANGTSNFIGTIYADTVNLTGTADLSMDTCFLSNVSPALLDFNLGGYRELDR
jgi:hypothetical protein